MKKALVLLSLALLVCAMLTVISSAVFVTDVENGVGAYVRFDSRQTLTQSLSFGKDTSESIVYFDAEEIALRKIQTNPRWKDGNHDSQLWIATGSVDVIKYPYMRITYMAPTTDIKGETNFIETKTDTYLLNESGSEYAMQGGGYVMVGYGDSSRLSITVDGQYQTHVFDWSNNSSLTGLGTFMAGGIDIRLPLWPTALSDIYVYDVGFFETPELAASYNYEQEHLANATDLLDQDAPVLTAVAPEIIAQNSQGKIMGATTEMEYRKTGESWNDVTPDMAENGIPADVATAYHVRYKAKDGYNAGYVASIALPVAWEFSGGTMSGWFKDANGNGYTTTIDPETKDMTVVVPYGTNMTGMYLYNYGHYFVKTNLTNSGIGDIYGYILTKKNDYSVHPDNIVTTDAFNNCLPNGLNADGTPTELTVSVYEKNITYDEFTLTIIQENPYGVEIPTIGYNDAFANGVDAANARTAIETYVYPLLNEAVTVATCEVAEPTGADPFYKINFTFTGSEYLYTMRVVPVAIDGATLGSQIRKVGDTVDAIRFGTQINNFQTIKSDAADWGFEVQRGTLVTSAAILGGATLDHAFANGNEGVADVAGTVLYSGTEESDEIIYTAAVEGIPETEYSTALVARGYINICYKGEVVYTKYFTSKTASVNDVISAVENWEK